MRLVFKVGGETAVPRTILYHRYSLSGGETWYDTNTGIELDGSANQLFWQLAADPAAAAANDRLASSTVWHRWRSTLLDLVDWFVLDVRGIDVSSAARLLRRR